MGKMKTFFRYLAGIACMAALPALVATVLPVLAAAALPALAVTASGTGRVVETYTGEETFSIYVKGLAEEEGGGKVQIGTSAGEVAGCGKLSAAPVPIRTLLMLDNSVSIQKGQQERIGELAQDLIGGRMGNEQIALATFDEEIHYLTEYTDDYGTLKQALDGMTYQNQETYLTDVLYELLEGGFPGGEGECFGRIVIVSDGVDNKALGYTKEELYDFLENHPVPIYAVGCKEKDNGEQLKNMFALSRMTGGESFLLDETEDTLEITRALSKDGDIVRYEIAPQATEMDGSSKTVKLTVSGGQAIQAQVRMPQQELQKEPAPEPEPEPTPEPEAVPASSPEPAPQAEKNWMPFLALLIAASVAVIVAILGLLAILYRRKRGADTAYFEPFEPAAAMARGEEEERTLLLNQRQYDLILEDVSNPARSFQASLGGNQSVTVGRRSDTCDLCIDYVKTVSGRHCEIGLRGDRFYIKDLHSSNGTFINRDRVITESELVSGNIIRLGTLELRVTIR